jgi:menaquinone-specific isochorismate synthase
MQMVKAAPKNIIESSLSPLQPEQTRLVSYSVPWPQVPLLAFLKEGQGLPRVYWESRQAATGLAGVGIAAKLVAQGVNRFCAIQQEAEALFEELMILNPYLPEGVGPRLVGGFAFDPGHQAQGLWSAFPAAQFILPRYQLAHLEDQTWLTVNYRLGPEDDPRCLIPSLEQDIERLQSRVLARVAEIQAARPEPSISLEADLQARDLTEPLMWRYLVEEATQRIRRGELDKVVLARVRHLRASRPVEPLAALAQLGQNYPDCYRFLFEPLSGHAFYGATPELLVEIKDATVHTVAMAGSIRRGGSPEEDAALAGQLMANPKERHEHALVVEAIEENLRPLVAALDVPSQPGLCRLSNIQHLKTVIQGKLLEKEKVLPVIEVMHPTPAVGGRPRPLALGMIQEMEPMERGWYAAPIGWLDPQGNGMFAVAIRSAVSVKEESLLYAGAGIMADSQPEKEWQETQLKFKPLEEALREASRS